MKLTQLIAILRSDASAVDNPRRFRHTRGHGFGEEVADLVVRLLRLGRCGSFPCADCPNGFICDHDFAESDQDKRCHLQLDPGRVNGMGDHTSSQLL